MRAQHYGALRTCSVHIQCCWDPRFSSMEEKMLWLLLHKRCDILENKSLLVKLLRNRKGSVGKWKGGYTWLICSDSDESSRDFISSFLKPPSIELPWPFKTSWGLSDLTIRDRMKWLFPKFSSMRASHAWVLFLHTSQLVIPNKTRRRFLIAAQYRKLSQFFFVSH